MTITIASASGAIVLSALRRTKPWWTASSRNLPSAKPSAANSSTAGPTFEPSGNRSRKPTRLRLTSSAPKQRHRQKQLKELTAELNDRRNDVTNFSKQEGGLTAKLDALAKLDREFANFVEEFERAALANLQKDIRTLEYQLANAEGESRERARQKIEGCTGLVKQAEQTIARFDKLAVTALRKHFSDEDLNTIFRVLNRDLLEIPVGSDGIQVARQREI